MNNKIVVRMFAFSMSAVMILSPVTAFAQENEEIEINTVEEVESEEDVISEDIVVEESVIEDTTIEYSVVENVVDEMAVADEVVEEVVSSTPAFDSRALKHLNTAAEAQASLKNNSWQTGYASCNQVERCRKLATSLLVFKLNYLDGYNVIGTAYDMAHGDNNYILVEMKDMTTGEIIDKYYDFYMQDSNGNNIDNLFKYYTVDRITIVEKGEKTGEKKIGMYVYPTFASKSNGNVVLDINDYSELLSDEYRAFVEANIQ